MCEKNLPIVGNFMREKHKGTGHFLVPVEPLSPSLSLIEHGKGTFFLAARKYSCYLFHILTFRFTGKQLRFSLFRGRKERTPLLLPSLLSGYDLHGNCVGLQGPFFFCFRRRILYLPGRIE